MSWIDRLFRRRRIYDDLAEEIRAHLDERTDELVARGMSRSEARDAARRAFGNVTNLEEQARETWQWPTIESLLMDARFALRQIRRAPAIAATIILTLAVGIASTATVFSWTRAVLLDPLPGAGDPDRVMALETTTASGSWTPTSWLDYRDFRQYLTSFEGIAAAYPTSLALGDESRTERRYGELVSANFFDVLRVRPALGGFFAATSDDAEGSRPTVVIGYGLWQSRWRGDSSVIGTVIHVNRYPFTIVGVAPPAFHGSMAGQDYQIWVPASMLSQIVPTGGWWLRDRGTRTFRVLARLAPNVTLAAARDEVRALATRMANANGDVSKGMGGLLMPLWQSHYGVQDQLRAPLAVLLSACGLVLLIVCANTANLLLARSMNRGRELGLRLALGAPRSRLIRQLLTEASVLAAAGAALGLVCAVWLAQSLRWLLPSFAVPSLIAPRVDASVLAFATALACAVTLIAGIAPALHGSREAFGEALKEGGRAGGLTGHRAVRLRSLLVAAEMALAVMSVVGAGMFYRSFRNTRALDAGFNADHVAMASVRLTLSGYDSARAEAFLASVADRIRREPGVSAASYTDYVPLSLGSGSWEDLRVEGYGPQPNENMKLYRAAIAPDYFKVLEIPLLAGRDFTMADDSSHAAVMIVNEAFVRRFLADRPSLGVRVRGWGRWFTIVGVVQDSKILRLTEPASPYFYVPVRQVYRPEYGYTFLARSAMPPEQTARSIAQAVSAADPTVPVYNGIPLTDYIAGPLQSQQVAVQLLAALASVALLLAAIGLYGVIAYSVAQRTKEIGVRIALGAQRSDVLRVVAFQAGVLLAIGLVAGLGGSVLVGRLVTAMLYAVSPGDIRVLAGATAGLVAVAILATGIPARRAMRVDPIVALRAE
ncbi:MAG TPA: ABC transporter permease [Gemmatimonadaceae bacterium]|nr:ABC transporter permease [Gemmatimonadaceae bacterium]